MDTLGGYRLVRKLGQGTRSDVWLGSDGSATVAIKVFRHDAERSQIDAEIEALGRASHRHILRLEDLAMGPYGQPCLVLQRLSAVSLARLLSRSQPSSGEAVTILVPLARAVAELHRVGVAHGSIRPSSVLFDDAGAPVLAGFGAAELFGDFPADPDGNSLPPAKLALERSVANDLDRLAALCISMMGADSDLARWISKSSQRDAATFATELAEKLFQTAEAIPVRFTVPGRERDLNSIPPRIGGDAQSNPAPTATLTSGATNDVAALLHLPAGMMKSAGDSIARIVETGPLALVKKRVVDAVRPVRKPVWIMAGLAVVGVVVASALWLPGSDSGRTTVGAPAPRADASISPAPAPAPVSSGDDPVAAATALLNARAACFTARSILCLDGVDQQGSAAMDADTAHVRMLQRGGAPDGSMALMTGALPGQLEITVVERLGDSVLLSVTDATAPAGTNTLSLLLIRVDQKWNIRDLMTAGQPSS